MLESHILAMLRAKGLVSWEVQSLTFPLIVSAGAAGKAKSLTFLLVASAEGSRGEARSPETKFVEHREEVQSAGYHVQSAFLSTRHHKAEEPLSGWAKSGRAQPHVKLFLSCKKSSWLLFL